MFETSVSEVWSHGYPCTAVHELFPDDRNNLILNPWLTTAYAQLHLRLSCVSLPTESGFICLVDTFQGFSHGAIEVSPQHQAQRLGYRYPRPCAGRNPFFSVFANAGIVLFLSYDCGRGIYLCCQNDQGRFDGLWMDYGLIEGFRDMFRCRLRRTMVRLASKRTSAMRFKFTSRERPSSDGAKLSVLFLIGSFSVPGIKVSPSQRSISLACRSRVALIRDLSIFPLEERRSISTSH